MKTKRWHLKSRKESKIQMFVGKQNSELLEEFKNYKNIIVECPDKSAENIMFWIVLPANKTIILPDTYDVNVSIDGATSRHKEINNIKYIFENNFAQELQDLLDQDIAPWKANLILIISTLLNMKSTHVIDNYKTIFNVFVIIGIICGILAYLKS